MCERVTVGFDFTSDWMEKWREFFSQSFSVVEAKTTFRHSNENHPMSEFICSFVLIFPFINMTGFMKTVSIICAKSPVFHFDFTPKGSL